jgi:hypothetical protein
MSAMAIGARMILLGLAVVLAGCGSSSSDGSSNPAIHTTLTVSTKHGLGYTLAITGSGKKACATQTYRTTLPGGQPIHQSARLCGAAIVAGHPSLVQAYNSAESILIDVPASGCGKVVAVKGTRSTPLTSRCSMSTPSFRVTVLPQARRLQVRGLASPLVINFPRHVCKTGLCITSLQSA